MKYTQKIVLKNGTEALIRNSDAPDGANVYEAFNLTHAESDYLLSYPDENSYDPEQEAQFLAKKAESPNEIELVAIMDGKIAGMAGIEAVGSKYKVKHRAEFGISVPEGILGARPGKSTHASLHSVCPGSRICPAGAERGCRKRKSHCII